MQDYAREFGTRRVPIRTEPRRIPLVRLIGIVFFIWQAFLHRNWILDKWESLSIKEATPIEVLPRSSQLDHFGGKSFVLVGGQLQESWWMQDEKALQSILQLYETPQLQEVLSLFLNQVDLPGRLDLIFPNSQENQLPILMQWHGKLVSQLVIRLQLDPQSSLMRYFDASTQCVWGEPCFQAPLAGAALPIGKEFDFGGREFLLDHDLFLGIGEAPVQSVMEGRIHSIDTGDGLATIVMDHPGNFISRYSGIASLEKNVQVGAQIHRGDALGRLSARDTAELKFQLLRDGIFVRWQEWEKEVKPFSDSVFATMLQGLLQ